MDDDGRYKTALRGGKWSDRQAAHFQTANEVAVIRAARFPGVDDDQYGGRLFIPPEIVAATMERAQESADARQTIFAMADISRQPGGANAPDL